MPLLFLQLHIPLRLLCGGLLFTCNAVMWTFLAKALRYSSSSTWTTVTTTASNFISSVSDTSFLWLLLFLWCVFGVNRARVSLIHVLQAFLGQLIFGEAQISLWWVGISLTLAGLLVLQWVSPQDGQQNTVAKDE